MAWHENIEHLGYKLEPHPEFQAITRLILPQGAKYAQELNISTGIVFAALYDLLVSAAYYQESIANVGWMYCAKVSPNAPILTFPFVNACPVCTIANGEIVKCTGNKPESGKIGKITSETLLRLLEEIFQMNGQNCIIKTGQEPIDFVITDTERRAYLLGEIKAAPLVVLPLAADSEVWQESKPHGIVPVQHKDKAAVNSLANTPLSMLIPVRDRDRWSYRRVPLGVKSDKNWAFEGFASALQHDGTFFRDYLLFWKNALNVYETKDRTHPLYWLTNGCGSKGSINVSDSKTSVGMDRTDDIKKGIYQLLKIGAESRKNDLPYSLTIALISNIHAIRHYDDYFQPVEDLVWGYDSMRDKGLFHLYDGLFSFTRKSLKTHWLSTIFAFTDDRS
ncbi:MAG: hypothetical protein H9535_03565 [Ignavibacteria bacterium]|nr:hypothetical protein [Ignavibacteria bacterium]